MKITSIKFIEHIRPNCSCGTGYSEPDKFHVICDTGYETDVFIDIWYRSDINKAFNEGIYRVFPEYSIDNIDEVFNMYLEELKIKLT